MRIKWLPIGLVAGLLAAVVVGGTVLASGGDDGDKGGNSAVEVGEQEVDSLTTRIAEILGTDPQATLDAMSDVSADIEAGYTDAMLRGAVDKGIITAEQADTIRTQVQSGDYSGLDDLWMEAFEAECGEVFWVQGPDEVSYDDYYERVGAVLDLDGQKVANAFEEAYAASFETDPDEAWDGYDEGVDPLTSKSAETLGISPQVLAEAIAQIDTEIELEYVDATLRGAVENGHITKERADAIRAEVQSGDYSGFDHLWDSVDEECGLDLWFEEPEEVSHQEYSERVGKILNVDGQKVADAIDQAYGELYPWDEEAFECGGEEGSDDGSSSEPAAAGAKAG